MEVTPVAGLSGKIERKYMAHYIDTSFDVKATPSHSWERLGKDLEELIVELNPDTETSKNILGESSFKHNGYEASATVDPLYAEIGDPLFAKLQTIVDNRSSGGACHTYMLEVHLWETNGGTGTNYVAYREECYVVPSSYGGDTSGYQIPFEIHPVGNRTAGTATISSGTVTFTAST